jgi:hypothetical protein
VISVSHLSPTNTDFCPAFLRVRKREGSDIPDTKILTGSEKVVPEDCAANSSSQLAGFSFVIA